jgi:hypothetical protein
VYGTTVNSMSEQSGLATKGTFGQAREEDAASVYGLHVREQHYERTVRLS